jgi:hypothetical protein
MPNKDSIRLDPGKMCFVVPEDCPPLPNLYETEEIETEEEALWPKENPYIKAAEEASFTGTINIETEEAREAMRKVTAIAEAAARVFSQVWETVKKMVDSCTNRRVLYLATHGSPRVRKKNVKRLVRYYRRMQR